MPATPISLTIVAEEFRAVALFSSAKQSVTANVQFLPEAGGRYLVKGEVSEQGSSVWLEDLFGNIVSKITTFRPNSRPNSIRPAERPTITSRTRPQLFQAITGGESVATVVAKLGEPEHIEKQAANHLNRRPSQIIYQYQGLGGIAFLADSSTPLGVYYVLPLAEPTPLITLWPSMVKPWFAWPKPTTGRNNSHCRSWI
ncbi:hypothetical protein [Halioxenophilus sp. WMMB6]|uniref:hypothetical protein n=1 Tax=Halioxenophilus sp. WMMB6 TaxID=3073815 RepID=UPI00295F0670|nr:hypothetical protein [Halioxenophilus sp. WMMB6]